MSLKEKANMLFELKEMTNTEDLIDFHMYYMTSLNNSERDGIIILHGNFNNEHKLKFLFN